MEQNHRHHAGRQSDQVADHRVVKAGRGKLRIFHLQKSGRPQARKEPRLTHRQPCKADDQGQNGRADRGPDQIGKGGNPLFHRRPLPPLFSDNLSVFIF
ncbi:MAG: hypothetical protein HY282_05025 [Nitrospirae bacterium]|nr:hypothetical protein [Candidatus Manganitrophaceae bacterium]